MRSARRIERDIKEAEVKAIDKDRFNKYKVLLISQFVTNQICSHVTDLPSFVSLAFLYNPADFLSDYLFHLQCYV